ncbi:MAG: hypothetical protein ABIS06_21260 [Vicinamibacterales bacterium]
MLRTRFARAPIGPPRTRGVAAVDGLLVTVLLGVWAVTWLPRAAGPLDLRWDGAAYYILGTSLAQGEGYRLLNEPGKISSIQYPPGLPAIVALHQRLLGTSDPVVVGTALRKVFVALSGIYLLSVFILLRSALGRGPALVGALTCALGTLFIWISDRLYSDLPFLALLTLFLLASKGRGRVAHVATGLLAVAAFLLRTVGAALLVAWIVEAAHARRWRQAGVRLLITALVVGAWQGYVWQVQHGAAYRQPAYAYQRAPYLLYNVSYTTNASLRRQFFPEHGFMTPVERLQRFAANLGMLPRRIGEAVTTSADLWAETLAPLRDVPVVGLVARWRAITTALFLIGAAALAGGCIVLKNRQVREPSLTFVYVLGVCTMALSEEFARYLTGLTPVFVLFALTAMAASVRRMGRPQAVLLPVAVVALSGQALVLQRVYRDDLRTATHWSRDGRTQPYRLFSYGETYRDFDDAITWIAANVPPGAIVASSQPHWVFLRTGRRAVMPPFERNGERQQALLDSVPVDYLIVDGSGFSATREYALPAIQNSPVWERVYDRGTAAIYRRSR